uniref:Uncharacterized protein n=1 Tax=Oryza sativa subsp. japonica TaxID=39947 RepID=Q338Y4_ORYSJ|nr:hypothetical protein LOC_Os10g23240 [Oryza sativa Japonica Group]
MVSYNQFSLKISGMPELLSLLITLRSERMGTRVHGTGKAYIYCSMNIIKTIRIAVLAVIGHWDSLWHLG